MTNNENKDNNTILNEEKSIAEIIPVKEYDNINTPVEIQAAINMDLDELKARSSELYSQTFLKAINPKGVEAHSILISKNFYELWDSEKDIAATIFKNTQNFLNKNNKKKTKKLSTIIANNLTSMNELLVTLNNIEEIPEDLVIENIIKAENSGKLIEAYSSSEYQKLSIEYTSNFMKNITDIVSQSQKPTALLKELNSDNFSEIKAKFQRTTYQQIRDWFNEEDSFLPKNDVSEKIDKYLLEMVSKYVETKGSAAKLFEELKKSKANELPKEGVLNALEILTKTENQDKMISKISKYKPKKVNVLDFYATGVIAAAVGAIGGYLLTSFFGANADVSKLQAEMNALKSEIKQNYATKTQYEGLNEKISKNTSLVSALDTNISELAKGTQAPSYDATKIEALEKDQSILSLNFSNLEDALRKNYEGDKNLKQDVDRLAKPNYKKDIKNFINKNPGYVMDMGKQVYKQILRENLQKKMNRGR